MRLKFLLLLFMLSAGILNAQDTIRSLVITEARLNSQGDAYVELTNMGTKPVNLKNFEFGTINPWTRPWTPAQGGYYFRLPEKILQPGQSYVMATAYDFEAEQYVKKTPGFEGGQMRPQKIQMYSIADMLIHIAEPKGDKTDSVTMHPIYREIGLALASWAGRDCYYIEQHLSNVDSVVVDQVGGVFDENGQNRYSGHYNVAGVTGATGNSVLVRKFKVKKGNTDFANAKGVGADDSEWIPIQWPSGAGQWRDLWWTVGNHGDYKLDATTLESTVASVNFAAKTITVPWGTRRGDGVMRLMKKKPGIAWTYQLSPNYADSLTFAARTGDKLNIIVCGQEGYRATFDIIVSDPTPNAKVVVPVTALNYPIARAVQWWRNQNQEGILSWPRVTENASGKDSITGNWYGVPYATRIDTLLARLEKPSNARWEIVPVDGTVRPDLKHGDKLKITAQNGTVKEYFIEVQPIQPNHVAYLASITWPDIPAQYRGLYGWKGDTIPGFVPTTYNYRISVPLGVPGIPALVAKTQQLNSTVKVKRAVTLDGTTEQRTISFEVTAEDDSVKRVYNVELVKEKDPSNIQPYFADPILSEIVFWEQWSNSFGEIANPGNQPLDLSNYMIAMQWNTNPSSVIQSRVGVTEWLDRYDKYVPGYKWVNEAQWAITPGILQQDLNVNAIVMPGDVFCFGGIWTDGTTAPSWIPGYKWPVPEQLDIQFNMYPNNGNKRDFPKGHVNPWGERISGNGTPIRKWSNSSWYMWKILNDSIKLGLKRANDPNDFELIETWSMESSTDWIVGGKNANVMTINFMRKPQFYEGKTGFGKNGSFGTNAENSEWTFTDRPYWQARNIGWPLDILNIGNDIGQHFMYEPTQYKSTISSTVYKVSQGYSKNEKIIGAKTGTTVAQFTSGITKANEKQTLTFKRGNTILATANVLQNNDVLEVLSADSTNTTKYALSVTAEGLSSNAVITSVRYIVNIEKQPKNASAVQEAGFGTVKGFEYGTALRTVLANINVPTGASLTVINSEGAYVPLRILNFDSAYVNVTVNDNIYLNVVAENGVTQINYQLIPSSSDNDAFILSDVYSVVQKNMLIDLVPRGTTVKTLLSNLVPSVGATMKVLNKMGQQRFDGGIAQDDKVTVTSRNGAVSKTYYISHLSSAAVPVTYYLAYILSNSYAVDQVMYVVSGVSGSETISSFLSKITPSVGAKAVVVDKNGIVKTTGDINGGDKVRVTSADGKMINMYSFGPLTAASLIGARNIELYPNPTTGQINVSGLAAGYRIQVYNSVGASVRDIKVQSNVEGISLGDQPSGMYMIVVSDKEKMLGRYKLLKQ